MKASSALLSLFMLLLTVRAAESYQIYVTNERAGDVTVISGDDFKVIGHIPVGKRPRGIRASPDGKYVYVAVSGTPLEPLPQLDKNGNPILNMNSDPDEVESSSDKSADGIAVIDVAQQRSLHKLPAGSDPENFALNADGTRIYIANEDVSAATILNTKNGEAYHLCACRQRTRRRRG